MVGVPGTSPGPAGVDRLTRLINANSADLLSYFIRRTEVAEDAADLLSETMTATWRRIRALPEGDERARMWMFGTARRVLANHHRGMGRKSALTERLRSEISHAELAAVPNEDELAHVRQAVIALPPKLREVVALVHWDGFTLTETATILGTSASTVRSRYSKARATLRQELAPPHRLQSEVSGQTATALRI